MRSFMIRSFERVLLKLSCQAGCSDQDVYHAWGRREMRSLFWWTNVKARGHVVQCRRRLFTHTDVTDISI